MRNSIYIFAIMMAIFCFNLTASKSKLMAGHKRDSFYPVARVVGIPVFLSNDVAFSFLAEGGPRSYRFNGTLGWISDCSRFKISAEELTQRVRFDFHTGRSHHWLHQFAIGGQYQHMFDNCNCFLEGIELGLTYSNASGKSICAKRLHSSEFVLRRIAGSWSWTAEAGLITNPWECSQLIGSITYDQVRYRRECQNSKRISGVGFSLDFKQRFWGDLLLDIQYDYKRFYNDIFVTLRWNREFEIGALDIGLFTYHVWGKSRLPSSTTAGVELGFAFGICDCNIVPLRSGYDYGDCCNPCIYNSCDLLAWVLDPAVFMPQVLAISDQFHCCNIDNSDNGHETTIGIGTASSEDTQTTGQSAPSSAP